MPRLSIIIPVLGDPKLLDDTLVSVLENRPANCEILVFHNQPYCDPYQLAGEVRFFEVDRKAGLVECLNLGLSASRSPVIHVIACGVEVSPGWADAAMRHFHDPQVASVAAVVLHRDDCRKVVSAGLGYRSEGETCRLGQGSELPELRTGEGLHKGTVPFSPTTDSLRCPENRDSPPAIDSTVLSQWQAELCGPDLLAAFYCKSTLQEVGGFSHWASDVLVGIDAALAIRQAGFRCALEPACSAKTDAASVEDTPTFRLGLDFERLFWRWASAHGWMRSLMGHAALAAGQCVLGLWHPRMLILMAGRAWGAGRWMLGSCLSKRATRFDESRASVIVSPHFAPAEESDNHCGSARAA